MALRSKPKFSGDEIVVAWTSGATNDHVVVTGDRLRGDHPAVLALPSVFVPDGTPRNEWPNVWDSVQAPNNEGGLLPPQPPPIPDDEAAVCVTGFTNLSRTINVGNRLRRDDPLVRANPEFFRTPMMKLDG